MKKILGLLLIIILLITVYYYFTKVNDKVIGISSTLNSITICGKQYYINDMALDDKSIMPMIAKIINYNYKYDDVAKPTSNPIDPTEYMKYSVRPFVIASSTCVALAKGYDGKELHIHDIKNTPQVKSFYLDNIILYVYPNNTNSILINLYPNDPSGMNGPYSLEIK